MLVCFLYYFINLLWLWGNKERGLARVKSLLKMFGLEKCLYENQELGMTNLNWNLVEERLYEWRKKIF